MKFWIKLINKNVGFMVVSHLDVINSGRSVVTIIAIGGFSGHSEHFDFVWGRGERE